jgi:DNA-binding CsgD family transcriptional regulator
MTRPASDPLTDIPPAAHDTVASLLTSPTASIKVLVSGGIGTGKSSVLTVIRSALREAGVAVLTRPPRDGDDLAAAVVIDDAHLLDDAELGQLCERVADPASTVVVATEPLAHHPALRALATTMERESPVVSLGALSPAEVNRAAAETLGAPPSSEIIRPLMVATAGLPKFALIERLRRLDEPVLDTLLISSLSPELGTDDVAAALRVGAEEAQALVDRARASGLIEPSHSQTFLRSVHRCIAGIIGNARHHDTEISLLVSQLESSTLSADLALRMAEHGLQDDRLAAELTELASRTRGQPGRAARLYRAAADAGATALSARLADALALTGDCTTAGRLADELLGSDDAAERAAAVRIAASIAMHDGSAAQAADLFRWLGPYPDEFVSASGAIVSIAAGDLDTARAALSAQAAGPPTSTARAARSLAEGLLLSLDQPFPIAVARLGHSITAEQQAPGVAPDTPAALVTLAALHGGDPVRARSVIGRAVRAGSQTDTADESFTSHRHRLLLGWVRMQGGQLSAAAADVASTADATLHRRDALWAAALRTAIARRSGDSGAVQKHWYAAVEVLAEYSTDLFSLLPLGELWVAAARMRQVDRLHHTLTEAFALLDSLGNPVLWSVPLHWAGVHAGILASSPEAVAPHGQALTAAAAHSAFAKALASAGRTWLRVLANHVDTDEVTAAARGLSQFGLTWDATRLASQAALQTPDGRVSGAMLQLARDLKQTIGVDDVSGLESVTVVADGARSPSRPASSKLSDREREVAELLLLGMPYRDIGSQLFISAKTVEHHVARIRRRLGAESRSEMLSMLRALLTPQG